MRDTDQVRVRFDEARWHTGRGTEGPRAKDRGGGDVDRTGIGRARRRRLEPIGRVADGDAGIGAGQRHADRTTVIAGGLAHSGLGGVVGTTTGVGRIGRWCLEQGPGGCAIRCPAPAMVGLRRLREREVVDDGPAGITQHRVVPGGLGELEAGVRLRSVHGIAPAAKDHQAPVRGDRHPGGDGPLGVVRGVVAQVPSGEVHQRTRGVVEFDPIRAVAITVGRPVDVGGAHLVQDHLRVQGTGKATRQQCGRQGNFLHAVRVAGRRVGKLTRRTVGKHDRKGPVHVFLTIVSVTRRAQHRPRCLRHEPLNPWPPGPARRSSRYPHPASTWCAG